MKPKPDIFMPALYGGLVTAAFWAIPGLNLINCFCCGGVLFGGILSVFLYARELRPEMAPLTVKDCLRLGLYSGVVASVAAVAINVMVTLVFGNVAIDMMERIIRKMKIEMPPEFEEMVAEARQQKLNPVGAVLSIFVYLIPNTMFGSLGGLIGWSIFKPKPRGE